jgi:hypothetical protein
MKTMIGGALLPPDGGEETALRFLEGFFKNQPGYILTNVYVPDRDDRPCECDIIVINENGVYDLEVKNWYGQLYANDGEWIVHGAETRTNPATQATRNASIINGFLKSRGYGWVSTSGLAVLVGGLGNVTRTPGYKYAGREFALDARLIEAITGRDYVHNRWARRLNEAEMAQICDLLFPAPEQPRQRDVFGFIVTQRGRYRGYYTEFIGYDPETRNRSVRIKAYRLPEIANVDQLQGAVERFKREVTALFAAGEHENLVKPVKFARDLRSDDGYFLILEHPGLMTLTEALRKGPLPPPRRCVILRDVAAALTFCHAKGFIHRNLSPEAIYLTKAGRAKVGDFDLVRMPDFGLTVTASKALALLSPRHVAPEQLNNIHQVDERVDVYALGAVWYDMLFTPQKDEQLQRSRLDEAQLNEDAKALWRRMVAPDPDDRPATMRAVAEELDALVDV